MTRARPAVPRSVRASAPTIGIVLATVLGGCAATGAPVPTETTNPDAPPLVEASGDAAPRTALAERLGTAASGARVPLESASPLDATAAIVGDAYTAASGHRCRRLTLDEPTLAAGAVGPVGPSRIVCRDGAGRWYLPRELVRRTL